ncbi:phospholipase D-like domain-containing protein [Brevibacillus sp. TJ4]|uniref:phospholipase D-like domain-containing protein n=1 Tax=Brevibacillus sp. TJ4 TaxID=3234853 RepID=UPI003BA1CA12
MYRAYFEVPSDTRVKHEKGSSPYLLKKLMVELQGAESIQASFFLYNNRFLHDFLQKQVLKGTQVTVYTIPLDGYSEVEVSVSGYREKKSKRQFAEKIFQSITQSDGPVVDLRLFPHTYVWSETQYNRGTYTYSLHAKCVLATFKDGKHKCILTSSNLACADQSHSENMLVIEGDQESIHSYMQFFRHLRENSLSLDDYKDFKDAAQHDAYYKLQKKTNTQITGNAMFTAPWFFYNSEGSPKVARTCISKFIKRAQSRIYICTQHVNDYNPFGTEDHKGIVELLIEIAKNQEIEIKVLKQTTSEQQKQGNRAAKAANILRGLPNVEQKFWHPVIHDKFIIVDNSVVVMTANVTPTQFAWDEDRDMVYVIDNESVTIPHSCFAEVNAFQFITDDEITAQYEQHFLQLWKSATNLA